MRLDCRPLATRPFPPINRRRHRDSGCLSPAGDRVASRTRDHEPILIARSGQRERSQREHESRDHAPHEHPPRLSADPGKLSGIVDPFAFSTIHDADSSGCERYARVCTRLEDPDGADEEERRARTPQSERETHSPRREDYERTEQETRHTRTMPLPALGQPYVRGRQQMRDEPVVGTILP